MLCSVVVDTEKLLAHARVRFLQFTRNCAPRSAQARHQLRCQRPHLRPVSVFPRQPPPPPPAPALLLPHKPPRNQVQGIGPIIFPLPFPTPSLSLPPLFPLVALSFKFTHLYRDFPLQGWQGRGVVRVTVAGRQHVRPGRGRGALPKCQVASSSWIQKMHNM